MLPSLIFLYVSCAWQLRGYLFSLYYKGICSTVITKEIQIKQMHYYNFRGKVWKNMHRALIKFHLDVDGGVNRGVEV